jgi:hypothetical protein
MKNNNYIRDLVTANLSVIPITEGAKKPHYILGKNHTLLTRLPTPEEIEKWLTADIKSWGIACGAVSGNLVTLDFDEKHYPGLYELWYAKLSVDQKAIVDSCYKNNTRNHGTHLRYRTETSQPTIKLSKRYEFNNELQKEEIVTTSEVRGEGSYALIPPSAGYQPLQGDLLDLPLVTDEMHEELIDILRTFDEIKEESAKPSSTDNNSPSNKFNELATWQEILGPHKWVEDYENHWRRPGKKQGENISATTNYKGRPMFYVFSSSADPFEQNKGYSKFHTYTLLNHKGDFKKALKAAIKMHPEIENKDGTNLLLGEILARPDVTLFHDEQGEAYISLEINDHQEIWSLKSKAMKRLLARMSWDKDKKPLSGEVMKSTLGVLEGKAFFEGPKIKLQNRVAWHDDVLWYDLTNEKYESVRLDTNGWKIIDRTPIIFKRYSHHKAQVLPIENGDIKLFLKYVNITDEAHQLLLLVFIVSCFIPDFPHPMLIIFGAQGSSKSTMAKLTGLVTDPSIIDIGTIPGNLKELIQSLAHHHFSFFDNLSYISDDISDLLCKAITGGGFTKRELFSDDEDIIYNFMRCIGMNGINLVANRPDLLERSLLLELERIDSSTRKDEGTLYKDFYNDLPSILGGVFDTLVKTLQRKPDITLESLPRMADFAIWGSAIVEALGYTKEVFLSAYQVNTSRQVEMLLSENSVATAIFSLMENVGEWKGTCTELLKQLTDNAYFGNVDIYEKYWPKGAGALSRRLNELRTPLKQLGYEITITTSGTTRSVRIQKITSNTPEEKVSVQGNLLADDIDDIS